MSIDTLHSISDQELSPSRAQVFFERGDRGLIPTDLQDRVEVMLAQLDVAGSAEAMRIPNYRLHALKGDLKGHWSVTVKAKANWRLIFRFEGEDVYDVELIDYH